MISLHPVGAGFGLPNISSFGGRIGVRLKPALRRADVGLWGPLTWALERMLERYVHSALAGADWSNSRARGERQCCGTAG